MAGMVVLSCQPYFQSFNQTRSLTTRVIHYPDGRVTGIGIFALPLAGQGSYGSSGRALTGTASPREVPATAFFLSGPRAGQQVPFTLDLHSTFFPDQTTVFDMATLSFCSGSSSCGGIRFTEA
jgi:hypothetical protein